MVRDHSHPSVVMWSIANEPVSEDPRARRYFQVRKREIPCVEVHVGIFLFRTWILSRFFFLIRPERCELSPRLGPAEAGDGGHQQGGRRRPG